MSTVINNEQSNFAPYNVTLIIAPDPQANLTFFLSCMNEVPL